MTESERTLLLIVAGSVAGFCIAMSPLWVVEWMERRKQSEADEGQG